MDCTKLVEAAITTWNSRDEAGFTALFAPTCEITMPGPVVLSGPQAAAQFWRHWCDAFPDNRIEPKAVFGTATEAVEEAVFVGTHTGPLTAPDGSVVPPTGRSVSGQYAAVYTAGSEGATRVRLYYDQIDILTQLGLMPAPAS